MTPAELERANRKQLQLFAKVYGVKANSSSKDIRAALSAILFPQQEDQHPPPTEEHADAQAEQDLQKEVSAASSAVDLAITRLSETFTYPDTPPVPTFAVPTWTPSPAPQSLHTAFAPSRSSDAASCASPSSSVAAAAFSRRTPSEAASAQPRTPSPAPHTWGETSVLASPGSPSSRFLLSDAAPSPDLSTSTPSPVQQQRHSIMPTLNIVLTPARKAPMRPATPKGSLGASLENLARIRTPGAATPSAQPRTPFAAALTWGEPSRTPAQPRSPSAAALTWGEPARTPGQPKTPSAAAHAWGETARTPGQGWASSPGATTPGAGEGRTFARTPGALQHKIPSRIVGSQLYEHLKSERKKEREESGVEQENTSDFCSRINGLCSTIRQGATPHAQRTRPGPDDTAGTPLRLANRLESASSLPAKPAGAPRGACAEGAQRVGTPGKAFGERAPNPGTPGTNSYRPGTPGSAFRRSIGLSGASRVPLA